MSADIAERRCEICSGPLGVPNKTGICQRNKECARRRSRKYYWMRPELMRAKRRRYGAENREKERASRREYAKNNPEKRKETLTKFFARHPGIKREYAQRHYYKHPERNRSRKRRYDAENPETGRANCRLRRARKRGLSYERFDRDEILARDGWRCRICGKTVRTTGSHHHALYANLDHIVPLSKGGGTTRDNTQTLCHGCNLRKSSRLEICK